ncbi:hypothetical protein L3X38_027688 [Prunus dulcis]|uniref:Uncharacterized protein n=1 Tax=Prunus dulcis TaxID=3755 RepID=A0AAD4VQP5_PRUDU|nr:hypothetical protein L3X38_027688 [Prunus dulcis]
MAKVLPQLNFFIILVLLGSAMFTKAIVKENNSNGVTSADPSCRKIIYGSYCPQPRGPLRLGKEDECSVRCPSASSNSIRSHFSSAGSALAHWIKMFILNDPLDMWFLSLPVAIPSDKPLNSSLSLNKTSTEARVKRLQIISGAPIVSPNPPIDLNLSVPIMPVAALVPPRGKSRRRRKDSKVDNMSKVVPPPPPPRRTVPSRMQKFIWSLTPKEALVYAKKEVEHAPAVMEDDPDLYAPIFRNISVFKR